MRQKALIKKESKFASLCIGLMYLGLFLSDCFAYLFYKLEAYTLVDAYFALLKGIWFINLLIMWWHKYKILNLILLVLFIPLFYYTVYRVGFGRLFFGQLV